MSCRLGYAKTKSALLFFFGRIFYALLNIDKTLENKTISIVMLRTHYGR